MLGDRPCQAIIAVTALPSLQRATFGVLKEPYQLAAGSIISEVSQPRENEPPACEWVGSNHSNEVRFEDLNPDQS